MAGPAHAELNAGENRAGISVIICCHNSRQRLGPTLAHLAAQQGAGGIDWEIVLVDNGSTDGTAEAADAIWRDHGAPAPLRIVPEPTLGLVNARIAGVAAAACSVLSFVDDDNWVCPSWVATIDRLMRDRPEITVIGGTGSPAFEGEAGPFWFDHFARSFACGPQAAATGWIDGALPRVYGAGMTLRRDALRALFDRGFRPFLTGRAGGRLLAGEDSEICYALGMSGARFWYQGDLTFRHFMPQGRLTLDYALKMFWGFGYASPIEDAYRAARSGASAAIGRLTRDARPLITGLAMRRWRERAARHPDSSIEGVEARIAVAYREGRIEGLRDFSGRRADLVSSMAAWRAA